MSKTKINKKMMEFMYFLTKQRNFMNSQQISKILTINNKKITDRTIRRWFNILKKDRNFNYFLNIKQTQIGLLPVFMLAFGVKTPQLFKLIPYTTYITNGTCLKDMKRAHFVQFAIPPDNFDDFITFWKTAKKFGLVSDFLVNKHKQSICLHRPLHKMVDKRYRAQPCMEPLSIQSIGLLEEIFNEQCVGWHPEIKKHPILVPIFCESFGEHTSSHKLWGCFEAKLGDKLWDFFPKKLNTRTYKAISYIQSLSKLINIKHQDLIQQVKVGYTPVHINNIGIYLIFKGRVKQEILSLIDEIKNYSVHTVIYPCVSKKYFNAMYVNVSDKTIDFVMDIVHKHLGDNSNKRIFMQDRRNIKNTFFKIDYPNCFDPKTCTWKYEHKKYMRQIKNLAKEMKSKKS